MAKKYGPIPYVEYIKNHKEDFFYDDELESYEYTCSDFTLEELAGKRIFLLDFNDDFYELEELGTIVNAELVGAASEFEDIDYVLVDGERGSLWPDCKENQTVLNILNDLEHVPPFICRDTLRTMVSQNFTKKIANESVEEKVARAKKLYDDLSAELKFRMEDDYPGYDMPIVREASSVVANKTAKLDVKTDGVAEFFAYVVEHSGGRYETTYSDLFDSLMKGFEDMIDEKKCWYPGGYLGIALPLGLLVALFVFVDTNSRIDVKFTRNKHEYRDSSYADSFIALALSPVCKNGVVYELFQSVEWSNPDEEEDDDDWDMDEDFMDPTWEDYEEEGLEFSYREGLTEIEDKESFGNTALISVNIPEGVEVIGEKAYANCKNLKLVTLPKSLRTIKARAFKRCSSLCSIEIQDGCEEIGYKCFIGCTSLTEITVPASVTSIGDNAFGANTSQKTLYVAAGSYAEEYAQENGINYIAE